MITKEDMQGYLRNMLRFEREAESGYKELLKDIKDRRIRKELAAFISDEKEHVRKVQKLIKLFEDE